VTVAVTVTETNKISVTVTMTVTVMLSFFQGSLPALGSVYILQVPSVQFSSFFINMLFITVTVTVTVNLFMNSRIGASGDVERESVGSLILWNFK
jgi:hypothetical protein